MERTQMPAPTRREPDGDERRNAMQNLRFRRFAVEPNARLLLRDGEAVDLGSRAFDLLMILLRQRGRVVLKAEISRHVWPDTQVEESNLRFQMVSLRAALGADRDLIKTIPGRGYLFVDEPWDGFGAPPLLAAADAQPTPSSGPVGPVAIIEDNPETREALEGLLQSAGLEVRSFASVPAYTSHAWATRPGCLVLDVLLPGQSGLDLQAALRSAGTAVPIIFISGHADVHMGVEAMKAGAADFLVKPVRHRDLIDAVRLAIRPPAAGVD